MHWLLDEWDAEKNGELTPRDIPAWSKQHVWWRCEKGHSWQAAVNLRIRSRGCPVCDGKIVIPGENDLASAFPELVNQWHPTKNLPLTPESVTPYSNRKVWWVCEKGHEWQTMVLHRTKVGSGCPYCSGKKVMAGFNDLAAAAPEIAAQWHPTLNGDLTPQMVTAGSHKKVWWRCDAGHEWQAAVFNRTGAKSGCPICARKKHT